MKGQNLVKRKQELIYQRPNSKFFTYHLYLFPNRTFKSANHDQIPIFIVRNTLHVHWKTMYELEKENNLPKGIKEGKKQIGAGGYLNYQARRVQQREQSKFKSALI